MNEINEEYKHAEKSSFYVLVEQIERLNELSKDDNLNTNERVSIALAIVEVYKSLSY
ncbi:hypothetical protein AAK938_01465 [Aerococcaceae bacterium 50-4]